MLGKNIGKDKIIKKTTDKENNTDNVSKTNKFGMPSQNEDKNTFDTKKMTFYFKNDKLEAIYNFAYWERLSKTEALDKILTDGLKGKNIKPRPIKK